MCAPKPICFVVFLCVFFRRNHLFSCPQDVRAAYKGLVRPILEYGSSVWDPHYEGLIDDLEKVQKRAARFVTRNYTYEKGSMTDILKKIKWESLQKRRKDNRIILLYKGLKGRAKIHTDDLIPQKRRCSKGVGEAPAPASFFWYHLVQRFLSSWHGTVSSLSA